MDFNIINTWIFELNSLWRIITLTVLLYAILRFTFNLLKNIHFKPIDLRIALFGLIFSNIYLFIELISYFISPEIMLWSNGFNQILKNNNDFYFLIASPFYIFFGVMSINVGWSLLKKATTNKKRLSRIIFFYTIGVIFLLTG